MKSKISFKAMTHSDIDIWLNWINKPYIKDVWFIEGYETPEYIHQKIAGNGYDYL